MKRAIAWFVDNPVAANLFMLIFVVGGLLELPRIHKEEFPNIETDVIRISVPFLGAAPEEVERAVCLRIEESIKGIEGIKRVNTSASEGICRVSVELVSGGNKSKALDDINAAVDGIDSFPVETEKPIVSEVTVKSTVLEFVISGAMDERSLKELAESVRDDLTEMAEVSQVSILYVRPYEISVEVSEQTLRRYGLSLERVAEAIRASSLDVPGGSVKSVSGEVMLRTRGQRYLGTEFEAIPVVARTDGTMVRLGDIATIVDGFEDSDLLARFDGKPAALLRIQRVGEEDTLKIARVVKEYLELRQAELPEGIDLTVWRDESQDLVDRLDTLLRNAAGGLLLVLLTLTLFLRFRIALWVAAGIPISVLGAIMLFPAVGLSISSLSVMGFLLALGILVDDAIVVGERIYAHELDAEDRHTAAVAGTTEVAVPVIFGVLTTMCAFFPIMTIPGDLGGFFSVVGVTVVLCLVFSVAESQLILPAHLAHRGRRDYADHPLIRRWLRLQDTISGALLDLAQGPYRRLLLWALEWRYLVFALALGALILVLGMIGSGRIMFQFFPSVEGDRLYATLTMPEGTAIGETLAGVAQIEAGAERLRKELDGEFPLQGGGSNVRHLLSSVGSQLAKGSISIEARPGSHFAEVGLELVNYKERSAPGSKQIAARWRELTGPIDGAVELGFSAQSFGLGSAIDIQLRGRDVATLGQAAAELREAIARYEGVVDITDTFRAGKQEMTLKIRPEAELLGLTQRDLGRQVRQAFYGEEAQRVQRGRDDVRVMVRYPESERLSLGNFENMRIRTAEGIEVPSLSVADASLGRGYSTIRRVDGRRVVRVVADVDRSRVSPEQILRSITRNDLPGLLQNYPDISYTLAGEAEERAESIGGLMNSSVIALMMIFALLAIPLHSYLQPLVIMSSIPFGLIGAILGHYIVGIDLVFFSLLGIVALSGVVVNASLVLVDYINRRRSQGVELVQAIVDAGTRRFRPILLTSVTTCVGLLPLIATANVATYIFVPMAVSLAFGVLFATAITLVLIPSLYHIQEDFKAWLGRRFSAEAERSYPLQ